MLHAPFESVVTDAPVSTIRTVAPAMGCVLPSSVAPFAPEKTTPFRVPTPVAFGGGAGAGGGGAGGGGAGAGGG